MIAFKNILVATDFSEPSDTALIYGRALAHHFRATLHVVHVVGNPVEPGLWAWGRWRVAGHAPGHSTGHRERGPQAVGRSAHRT
jgi:nucleotide-binding universal stress UspA family protein